MITSINLNGIKLSADQIPSPPTYQVYAGVTEELNLPIMNEWYARFDALPNVVKTDLGAGQDTSQHLYSYRVGNAEGTPILITSVMHGTENRPLASTYWLAYCVTRGVSPLFKWIRDNVELTVVPFCNPGGYLVNQRKNVNAVNNVDLNRNFDWRWSEGTIGNVDYGGTAAESEAETVILEALINPSSLNPSITSSEMKPKIFIDCHDTGTDASKDIIQNGPNYQISQHRNRDFYIGELGSRVIGEIDASSRMYDWNLEGSQGAKYEAAIGTICNYAGSLGASTYTMESHPKAWDADAFMADGEMTRAFVAGMVTSIITNLNDGDVGSTETTEQHIQFGNNSSFTIPNTFTTSPGYTLGLDTSGITPTNDSVLQIRSDNPAPVTPYDRINIEEQSTLILTLQINGRSTTAASRINEILYLKDGNDDEVGALESKSARQSLLDFPAANKYVAWPIKRWVFERLDPGYYYPKIGIWIESSPGDGILIFELVLSVDVIPATKLAPYYSQN